jgi:hypothetical protein
MAVDLIGARLNTPRTGRHKRCISSSCIGVCWSVAVTFAATTVTIESWDQLPPAVPSACHTRRSRLRSRLKREARTSRAAGFSLAKDMSSKAVH